MSAVKQSLSPTDPVREASSHEDLGCHDCNFRRIMFLLLNDNGWYDAYEGISFMEHS